MKHIVTSLYADYGRYIDIYRHIPKDVDCLKPVERRLLLSVHEVARKKFEKSAKIIGTCIGNYHPHGDASTYESLISLVNRGFVDGQGNWGKYGLEDSKAAAYRYTECKANDNLNNIFGDYLKFVPWEPLELENEPLYIPFPVPLGLIGSGIITGIGFHTTKIPRYHFKDLVKRLVDIIENKNQKTIIIPYVRDCVVKEQTPGEFEKILTIGEGKIEIIPNVIINVKDIIITGRHPIIGFNALKKLNEQYEEENNIPLFNAIDLWDYKCQTSIYIQITSANPKSKFIDLQTKDKIISSLSSSINVKINVAETNKFVKLKSIDTLLLENYNQWKDAILKFHQHQLNNQIIKLEEYKVINIIREILKSNPTIKNVEEIVKLNTSTYTENQIRYVCSKHNIRTLIEAHIDITSIQNKINSINKIINNIDNVVLTEIKNKFL